ncbi:MAG: hypothetical protein VB092_01020 [Oscillospiraceae bacterium]|nr:hypothetical protein [Oscillospiraceae bacterium]
MKRFLTALLCAAVAMSIFAGCKKQEEAVDLPVEKPETEQQTEVPNPMTEVKSSGDFEALGVYLSVPQGAENVKYYIISNELAEILFDYAGASFTYRAALSEEDISGVYEEFEADPGIYEAGEGDTKVALLVQTAKTGGKLVTWQLESATFSLYTTTPLTDDEIVAICKTVASVDLPKTLALLRNLK